MAAPAPPADSGSDAAAAAEQPLTLLHLPAELLAHIACFLDVDGGACLVDLEIQRVAVSSAVLERIVAHTSLTRLALLSEDHPHYNSDLPPSISSLSRLAVLQLDCNHGQLHRLAPLSQLRSLELGEGYADQEWGRLSRTLPHLRQLTSVRLQGNLQDTERRRPDTLTLLTGLAAVQLAGFAQPGQWAPVLAAAAAQGQRLTRLVLERCSQQLHEIPAELASLTALRHLTIKVGGLNAPERIVGGLQHLAGLSLTHLALEHCEAVLPPAFSRLSALECLSLRGWPQSGPWVATPDHLPLLGSSAQLRFLTIGGCRQQTELGRLRSLGCLTRLEVVGAAGQEWPAVMTSLTALKELGLYGSTYWGNGSWQPLAGLQQLTWMRLPLRAQFSFADSQLQNCPPALLDLTLRGYEMSLPPGVARHSSLTRLDLWGNMEDGELQPAGWPALCSIAGVRATRLADLASTAPLQQLNSLELNCSWQQLLPAELAQCTALHTLELFLLRFQCSDAGWEPLASLQQLTSLAMRDDLLVWDSQGVLAVPPSVSTLTTLKRLTLNRADKLDSYTMRHLRPLTRLTHVSLPGFERGLLPVFLFERQGLGLRITDMDPTNSD